MGTIGSRARRRFEEIGDAFPTRVARLLARPAERESAAERPPAEDEAVKPASGSWFHRPASRYFARLYCLLRYDWANAHAEEWWPHLSLTRPSERTVGEIRYRGEIIAPLMPYPTASGADEVVVVGSGPSLASQARERIPLSSALLLNGAIHLIGPAGERPLGVVIEDERFVWRHWRTIQAKVPPKTHCYLSTSVIRALCETAPGWLASQTVHHLDFVHRPYGVRRPDNAELRKLPFLRWSNDGKT